MLMLMYYARTASISLTVVNFSRSFPPPLRLALSLSASSILPHPAKSTTEPCFLATSTSSGSPASGIVFNGDATDAGGGVAKWSSKMRDERE